MRNKNLRKEQKVKRRVLYGLLAVVMAIALVAGGYAFSAPALSTAPEALKYMKLKHLDIPATYIIDVTVVDGKDDLPEYCRVKGYVCPSIHFEVRLPTSGWNGKFYMVGCGGFCGQVADCQAFANCMSYGLKRKYAVATTDSGHWGAASWDAIWAYHNRQKEIDWGHRCIHEVTRVAKVLISEYYGKPPAYSYFTGCSTGGKLALNEAQRYPEDFDGIISGAPALDYTGLAAISNAWIAQANRDKKGNLIIGPDDIGLIAETVYEKCDGQDGLVDGIISDPRIVDFDPACLLGPLTREQVNTLKKFYGGAKDSSGEQLYAGGLPIGSEPFWPLWVVGPAFNLLFGENFVKYMAFEKDPGPGYDLSSFDFDKDPLKLEFMAKIYNATNPDLSAFKENGGKLIMYQGWADSCVTPFRTVKYYESVVEEMEGLVKTQEFCRLFMVPGMDHCRILQGKGPDNFDILTPLENWVEKGIAPDKIIAYEVDEKGEVILSRPLYPYPLVAKYIGTGDPDDADNFEPADSFEPQE